MTTAEALQLLEKARGNDEQITLATVELAVSSQPSELQNETREAVYAAAVTHWFDSNILTSLLQLPPEAVSRIYAVLTHFSFVEPFQRYNAFNIHERTRLHLLAVLTRDHPEKYHTYSARAAAHFSQGNMPHEKIETAYHQLIAEPEKGAYTIGNLYDDWRIKGEDEALQALAAPIEEHWKSKRLQGKALAATLDLLASIRVNYQPLETTKALLDEARTIYRELKDFRQEGIVLDGIGNVQSAQGDFLGAQNSYQSAMEIRKEIARLDPNNTAAQRDLEVSYNKLGYMQEQREDFAAALVSYSSAMSIAKEAADRDSTDPYSQRDLLLCHVNMGDTHVDQSQWDSANTSYEAALQIAKTLVKKEPQNALWKQDLVLCLTSIGKMRLLQDEVSGALGFYEEAMPLSKDLVVRDPENGNFLRILSICYFALATIYRSLDRIKDALSYARQDLATLRPLLTVILQTCNGK